MMSIGRLKFDMFSEVLVKVGGFYMFGGQVMGRIESVSGTAGVRPQVGIITILENKGTAIFDVLNVNARATYDFFSTGRPRQFGQGHYLGMAFPTAWPCTMTPQGSNSLHFTVDVDHSVLRRMEQERKGRDVTIRLTIELIGAQRGASDMTPQQIGRTEVGTGGNNWFGIDIPKSRWLEILKELGFGNYLQAEILLPVIRKGTAIDGALAHLQRAWEHYLDGRDREVLAACHDALELLVKKFANMNGKSEQNPYEYLLSMIGSAEKNRLVGQALQRCTAFMHLGRHEHQPSVEVDHRDAELAILLTHACLAYLSKTALPKSRNIEAVKEAAVQPA